MPRSFRGLTVAIFIHTRMEVNKLAKIDKFQMWHLENFYKEQLLRELSQMFKWENLPDSVPHDYLERTLIRSGYGLFYYSDEIGVDFLKCTATGYNRHNQPTTARTWSPNTENTAYNVERKIKRLTDGEKSVENFNQLTDGVLIQNMEYGQNMQYIVDFYAKRLAKAQNAFDNSLTWSNIPYIFAVTDDDKKLSVERMFEQAQEGRPFTIVDKSLFSDNKDRTGIPTSIQYIGKELMDSLNEIMMKFRETVGFNTAGVDKAERVNTMEIQSNDQHTYSVLQIMLNQRKIACDAINKFFNLSMKVGLIADMEIEQIEPMTDEDEEDNPDGGTNGGTQTSLTE